MIRVNLIFACALALALTGAAEKKEASLESELTKRFVGQSYSAKIVFGNYIRQEEGGRECVRLIDTEYQPGGSVRYQARKACLSQILIMPAPNFYFEQNQLTSVTQPGIRLTVKKIEVKSDRIEFQLWANLSSRDVSNHAKLKLFVEGGTKQLTVETVLAAVADVLYIPEYEKQRKLHVEFDRLASNLASLSSQYGDTSSSADKRFQAGHALQDTLQKIILNRDQAGAPYNDPQTVDPFKTQIAALNRELPALEASAKAERTASIKAKISSNRDQCSRLKSDLNPKPASTMAEWQKRNEQAANYQQLLEERKNLLANLVQEGSRDQEGDDSLASESRELSAFLGFLNSDHKRLQLDSLNVSFQNMKKRKLSLMDKYARDFGTPQERASLAALTGHLQSMSQNRKEAKALGSEAAGKEAAQIDAELEKYKRR